MGIVALDCPYLGLHPGIVVAGISSLFQSSEQPPTEQSDGQTSQQHGSTESSSDLQSPQIESPMSSRPPQQVATDPYFDPPFFNDAPFREAPFRKRIANFAKKHYSEGILNATTKHVLSHLEYGGCLADFPGMNARYKKIRELEDVDDLQSTNAEQAPSKKARVRFVNYYTLSSGRKKQPRPSQQETSSQTTLTPITSGNPDSTFSRETTCETDLSTMSQSASQLSITVENRDEKNGGLSTSPPSDQDIISSSPGDEQSNGKGDCRSESPGALQLEVIDPTPITDYNETISEDRDPGLPPIPELPAEPTEPDFEQYADKDSRKQAEKEYKRVQKSFAKSVKDRNKAIKEREKLLQKWRAKEEKEARKLEKGKEKENLEESASAVPEEIQNAEAQQPTKPAKRKKFCTLPSKIRGEVDPTWVDVYMDNMDEVTAHCGLFFSGPHYDRLVGDMSSRVIGWVEDDMTKRIILEMQEG